MSFLWQSCSERRTRLEEKTSDSVACPEGYFMKQSNDHEPQGPTTLPTEPGEKTLHHGPLDEPSLETAASKRDPEATWAQTPCREL